GGADPLAKLRSSVFGRRQLVARPALLCLIAMGLCLQRDWAKGKIDLRERDWYPRIPTRGAGSVTEERVERRLAAILCADVVEYSRLMGGDEEKTLAVLKSHRRELIDPLIDQHRGRIFKTTGDGLLIEFASVVDAVRCAVVVQRGMEDRNANLREAERIRFRIGINLGDVIVDEGDMFGDGVNVAARIEAL